MNANYEKAKKAAREILLSRKIVHPPVDPVAIARSMGVNVYFVTFGDKDLSEKISGFYDAEDDAIYVNEEEFPLRQTFTVAHELGHRMLHREWAASNEYTALLRQDGNNNSAIEKEANAFAANLLTPRDMLDRFYEGSSPAELSRLFAVSVPVIKNRLKFEYGI